VQEDSESGTAKSNETRNMVVEMDSCRLNASMLSATHLAHCSSTEVNNASNSPEHQTPSCHTDPNPSSPSECWTMHPTCPEETTPTTNIQTVKPIQPLTITIQWLPS